jgi:hypothetical protein
MFQVSCFFWAASLVSRWNGRKERAKCGARGDPGRAFVWREYGQRAFLNGTALDISGPGKLRGAFLNWYLLGSLKNAIKRIEASRMEDNTARPDRSIDGQTPAAFAAANQGARRTRPNDRPSLQRGGDFRAELLSMAQWIRQSGDRTGEAVQGAQAWER